MSDIHDMNPSTTARHDNVDIGQRVAGKIKATDFTYIDSSGLISSLPKGESSLFKLPGRKGVRNVSTRQSAISNGAVGYTYHNNITVEGDIVAIKFYLTNIHTSTITNIAACAAPTSDFSNPLTPTGSWVDITSGIKTLSVIAANIRAAAEVPSITSSDWCVVNSVPPTDGGTLRYFCVRHFVPASNVTTSEGFYDISNVLHSPSALNDGRVFQTFRQDVDGISSKSAFTSSTPYGKPGLIMGYEYILATGQIINVSGFGDSIMEGAVNGGTGNFGNGWLHQAIRLFRKKHPNILIEHSNFGISGQNSATYSQVCSDRITKFDPDIIIYSPFSCNDGTPTQTTCNAQTSLTATIITLAKTANSPLVFVSGCPNTALGWNQSQDQLRRYLNISLLGISRMSRNIIDIESDLFDGVSAFKAGVSTDGTNPNEYGAGLIAENKAYPILRKVILGY